METPPVIKMNTFKYNSSSVGQPPLFFHNSNTMESPQLQFHSASVFSASNNQITYLKPPSETKSSTAQVVVEDAEISIFDAQKYFNDTSDPKTRLSISPSVISTPTHDDESTISNNNIINPSRLSCGSAGYNRVRSFHATPTASSEASWNSQTGLLSHPVGGLAVSLRNIPNPNSKNQDRLKGGPVSNGTTKWFKCPCSGKKSVQVREPAANLYTKPQPDHQQQQLEQQSHERVSISSTHSNNLIPPSRYDQFSSKAFQTHQQPRLSGSGRPVSESTTGGFSFPILNSLSLPTKHSSPLDEPPRDSLEVYQPVEELPAPRKAVGGRGFGFPGSPIPRVVALDDDIASDASSDLFEIESFSTQTTSYPMYRRRDSLDEAQNFNTRRLTASNIYGRRSVDEPMTPSIAPTECYEPSEASIDWSVTTAEGFDRSSVTNFSISASEFDEVSMARHAWMNNGGRYKKASGGGGGGGLLMSCRQEKAVSVGPQPVRCTGGEGQHGGMAPLMSTFMHVGGRVLQNNNNNINNNKQSQQPPLARSHSARLSRAFAA
ncbi:Protein PHYTOCHROME KINASE SUBSTRATE 4 [Heracleum sosnowskyi]|uniref:Protein PHYTOCHROME KINASE SUBSTRATE 4 n=1 Tax=Heracleum sosnowskyi TaxID=360622 RepID=A0AAD8IZG9_9APIA|nr:Protein PHYTOCHROME KINASE SUBSTRATE 4 [Heracleum sosnowskyi]